MTSRIDNFDPHADDYDATLRAALGFAGGDGQYFAERKMDALSRFYDALGRSPSRILEFGCGTGTNLPLLRARFPDAELHGLDVSEKSLEIAGELSVERCHLRAYAGEDLPYLEDSFDFAMAVNVFHHIKPHDRPAALQAIRRTLSPSGIAAIFEHNPHNPLTRKVVRDCPFDEGVVLLRPRETQAMFCDAGFSDVRTRFIVFVPPWLSALRGVERFLGGVPLGAQYAVFGEVDEVRL